MRLGIIGTGRIAFRCVEDCKYLMTQGMGIELVIYNPHMSSAESFAKAHGVDEYTDNWDRFIDIIDAGYVGSPHQTHVMYTKKLLLERKHVLCEKPMAFSKKDALELYDIAKANDVILMEAMKTAFSPGFIALCEMARSGKIGTITDVEAAFTRLTPVNCREYLDAQYGGSFTEFASYPLLPVLRLLGTEYSDIRFHSVIEENGVDSYTKAYISYGEKTATCKTGLGIKSEGQLLITGTNGYILAPSPWWLTKKFQIRYEDPGRVEEYEYPLEKYGLVYELQEFVDRLYGKKTISEKDAIREQSETVTRAEIMELFLEKRLRNNTEDEKRDSIISGSKMNIWAHRGCSMNMPENTIPAFIEAAKIPGITGIEFDVQFTKDGEIVVIHDETVDRTTENSGNVRDFTLEELQHMKLRIKDEDKAAGRFLTNDYHIPTLREVFDALAPFCLDNDLMLNIEFKTSVIRYEGIEQKVYDMVREYDKYRLAEHIVYSSFLQDSIKIIKEIDPSSKTGMLAGKLTDCIRIGTEADADAWHPEIRWLQHGDASNLQNKPVRAWNGSEPLYNSNRVYTGEDFRKYAVFGVTDLFTNEPERYLRERSL